MNDRKTERRGLGRGLSALMADVHLAPSDTTAPPRRPDSLVPVENLHPNPDQPRRDFDETALAELAESLRQKGVIQPLIVRPHGAAGQYQIVAGERRWRAAQLAQIHELPVLIRELDDTEVLEVAIIENIQRADLNALEEALGYRQLMDRFGHTQEKLAEALSKSRSHIANLLRLLQLPDEVQVLLRGGQLTAGHARALVTSPNAAELARQIVTRGLSVREAERLALNEGGAKRKSAGRKRAEKDPDTRALEADLAANLGMSVRIDHEAGGESGLLTIRYNSLEDLDRLCRVLSQLPPDADF